jgi:DNA sulfur modification protein DndD
VQITILDWNYKGIRGVNDLSIEIGKTQIPPITLIMMPNGTGKTTTLTLMRATLDGSATKWSSEYIRQFRPSPSINTGSFDIKLLIDEPPCVRIVVV